MCVACAVCAKHTSYGMAPQKDTRTLVRAIGDGIARRFMATLDPAICTKWKVVPFHNKRFLEDVCRCLYALG